MYGKVLGCSTATCAGAIVLPNTGGNIALTIVALVVIAVGSTVLASTLARVVLENTYKHKA